MGENKPDNKSVLEQHADLGHLGWFARLRAYFLAGILVTGPIGLTIYLTWAFLRFIDKRVTALIPEQYSPFGYLPFSVPGIELFKSILSLLIAVAFFVLVGWFVRNFLGRLLYQMSEYILHRMPVVRNVYSAIKQIFETVMTSQSQAFKSVVMFEYPRPGIWTLGFVSGTAKGKIGETVGEDSVSVFLPTAPSPTNGIVLFLPRKSLVPLDMSVEEGIKMVVSCGIIAPPDRNSNEERLPSAAAGRLS